MDQDTKDQTQSQQRSQSSFDTQFDNYVASQPGDVGSSSARQAWDSYFELADQTIRTARRVSEQQTLHLMRQEIVKEVRSAVIAELKKDPALFPARK